MRDRIVVMCEGEKTGKNYAICHNAKSGVIVDGKKVMIYANSC